MMNVRESFDITDAIHHVSYGLWRLDPPHDVIVGMGRRDNVVVIAFFAQVVIGASCALISDAFEVVLMTSITSNASVSNDGRMILPGSFILMRQSIRHICRGLLILFFVPCPGVVDLWGWWLAVIGRGIRQFP